MKLNITLLFTFCSLFLNAQGYWSFLTSVEEVVLLGSPPSSSNFTGLKDLAPNSGIRTGFNRTFTEAFSIEATLGVSGISSSNTHITKIVPVEVIGHYNVLPAFNGGSKGKTMKFNVDFGVGSSLVRTTVPGYSNLGNFSFSENLSIGASLDLKVISNGTLSFGYRQTMYVDDFIEAPVSGDKNNALGRFFTSIRWNLNDGSSSKQRAELNDEIAKADALAAELKNAKAKSNAMEKAILQLKSMKQEPLENEEDVSDMPSDTTVISNGEIVTAAEIQESTIRGYAIIIASYKSEELAKSLALELGNTTRVIAVPELGRFRVAYDVYDTYQAAKKSQKELVLDFANCWIVNL